MSIVEFSICEEDRAKFGGPEWVGLDVERLYDSPAATLERWEAEAGYSIARACAETSGPFPPARAVHVLVWLARKQHGANVEAVDDEGNPESFARLRALKTMRVRIRDAAEVGDAVPPAVAEPEKSKR